MIKMDDSDMRTVRSPRVGAAQQAGEPPPVPTENGSVVAAPAVPPAEGAPATPPLPEPERGGASFDVAEPRGTANDIVRQPLEFTPDGVYSLGGGWMLTLSADRLEVKRGRQQGIAGLAAASIRLGAGDTAIFGVLTRAHGTSTEPGEAAPSEGSTEGQVLESGGSGEPPRDEPIDEQAGERDNA